MPLLFTTLILPPTALDITPAWTAATHSGDDCNTEGEQDENFFFFFFANPKTSLGRQLQKADLTFSLRQIKSDESA